MRTIIKIIGYIVNFPFGISGKVLSERETYANETHIYYNTRGRGR